MLLVLPVVLGAWLGGFRTGIAATLFSSLVADLLFLEPRGLLAVDADKAVILALYLFQGLVISAFGGQLRRTLEALAASHEELEERVAHRTVELLAAKERLELEAVERERAAEELRQLAKRLEDQQPRAPGLRLGRLARPAGAAAQDPGVRRPAGREVRRRRSAPRGARLPARGCRTPPAHAEAHQRPADLLARHDQGAALRAGRPRPGGGARCSPTSSADRAGRRARRGRARCRRSTPTRSRCASCSRTCSATRSSSTAPRKPPVVKVGARLVGPAEGRAWPSLARRLAAS